MQTNQDVRAAGADEREPFPTLRSVGLSDAQLNILRRQGYLEVRRQPDSACRLLAVAISARAIDAYRIFGQSTVHSSNTCSKNCRDCSSRVIVSASSSARFAVASPHYARQNNAWRRSCSNWAITITATRCESRARHPCHRNFIPHKKEMIYEHQINGLCSVT